MSENHIKSEKTVFAQKYDTIRATNYFHRFQRGIRHRFLNQLELHMVKRGLKIAGMPDKILDIPCGTGRFWSVLKHHPSTILHAADFNIAMLSVGLEKREPHLTATMQGTVTSAFNLPFPDNSFDSIFCLRFIHHINLPDERLQLLRELARVTTTTVCISNWVVETGIKAKRLLRKEQTRKPGKHYDKFVMRHDQLLQEFSAAGFTVIDYTDLLPHLSSWRLYVLRKEQATSIAAPSITEYVCPVCKGALEHMLNPAQFICQHDKLAFPIHGKLPMLTQRDAITLD